MIVTMRKKKMTNNEVIIDYTKCKYYQKGECEAEIDYNGNYCDYTCESNVMNDCYYKQLQRKTQECEKLKEEMKQIKKDLRKRFSVQNVPDGDIIITCSKKQTCYAHLHAYEAKCKLCPNCYYKQLQRAKAEIEELKKQVRNNKTAYHTELSTYNMECGNLLEENKNFIEENERLKQQ